MQPTRRFRFILAIALTVVGGIALAAPPLPAFTARYRLSQNGLPVGSATLVLAPGADNSWTFTTTSRGTTGVAALLGASIRESSTFRWVGGLPQCQRYEYTLDSSLKTQSRTLRCDWTNHTIEVEDKGPHTFATQPGTLERHTVPLALAAGLAAGKTDFSLPVAVLDRVETQHYAVLGKQRIKVPAGTFDATRIGRTGDDDDFEAWFAPGKLPVPVKIDRRGKHAFSLELESWSAQHFQ